MSIDTDFRAALAGHAALTSLVGTGISKNAVPADLTRPLVVYAVRIDSEYGLDGTGHGDRGEIECQCWAKESVAAKSVADAVRGAIATVPDNALVLSERDSYDPELDMHAQILTIVWMV